MAVRCCWPPDSSLGLRFSIGVSFKSSAMVPTRCLIVASATRPTRKGEAMFS